MTRKRHTEKQIIAVLKDAQAGVNVQDLCRKENRRLKQMVVEQALDIQALKALTAKTGLTFPQKTTSLAQSCPI
jgi:putative transposase